MFGRFENFFFWLIFIFIIVVSIWFVRLPPREVTHPGNSGEKFYDPLNNITADKAGVGYLEITAFPDADTVYVDSVKFSQGTPYVGIFPTGEHRIKFINVKLNKIHETTVILLADERKLVHYNFDEIER